MICQTGSMDEARAAEVMAESAAVLRKAGARFAYLHGSRASGQYRPDSDIDIAAYFGGEPPNVFDVLLPPGVDLLVLDHAPLELAGRVAARGRLLFDDDPVSYIEVDDSIVVDRLKSLVTLRNKVIARTGSSSSEASRLLPADLADRARQVRGL